MWKGVYEAWYSVAPKFLEEHYKLMPMRTIDRNEENGGATKY